MMGSSAKLWKYWLMKCVEGQAASLFAMATLASARPKAKNLNTFEQKFQNELTQFL